MIDLSQIYDVVEWSKSRDREPLESVCLVSVPSKDIRSQYIDEFREEKDSSPSHCTIYYLGDVEEGQIDAVVNSAGQAAKRIKPFEARIIGTNVFENDDFDVYHSSIKSPGMEKLRSNFKQELYNNGIEREDKHPIFKPHITIEYAQPGEEKQFKVDPKGSWIVESVWLWGLPEPHIFQLGQ